MLSEAGGRGGRQITQIRMAEVGTKDWWLQPPTTHVVLTAGRSAEVVEHRHGAVACHG